MLLQTGTERKDAENIDMRQNLIPYDFSIIQDYQNRTHHNDYNYYAINATSKQNICWKP